MSLIQQHHPSWKSFVSREDIQKELDHIEKQIGTNFYPDKSKVLRFLTMDVNQIKCIIVGMDPYPSSYTINGVTYPEATGRSFEVASLDSWQKPFKQASLRNILKTLYYNEFGVLKELTEVRGEIQNGHFQMKEPKEWFDDMESQGVLFLNATLTVVPNKPNSHTALWGSFMNELVSFIRKNNPNAKWLLWGNKAQERILPVLGESTAAITTKHPRMASFCTENCFARIPDIRWVEKGVAV